MARKKAEDKAPEPGLQGTEKGNAQDPAAVTETDHSGEEFAGDDYGSNDFDDEERPPTLGDATPGEKVPLVQPGEAPPVPNAPESVQDAPGVASAPTPGDPPVEAGEAPVAHPGPSRGAVAIGFDPDKPRGDPEPAKPRKFRVSGGKVGSFTAADGDIAAERFGPGVDFDRLINLGAIVEVTE